jgi:xylulose-5-phosphate/fructose-6-phosphate phosphoketolase
MHKLFRQFSFPGGIPSHVAPETPGSIHEGGELGYALVHAYGAAFDNPDLLVCCVIGDGEAETGPLAASWHSNKFANPARDGAVLPVLHLNGYKIANPTVLARIPEDELRALLEGYGHTPRFVTGENPESVHQALAGTLDASLDEIAEIQRRARTEGAVERPLWPMIVLRTPKGWTGPKEVDGQPAEGNWRSHQVPLAKLADSPEHLRMLEEWMRSYRPEELFDELGRPRDELLAPAPAGERRMGANPHTNGGLLLRNLRLPDFRDYAVDVPAPGHGSSEAMRVLGAYLRDVMQMNEDFANFRVFGPDETAVEPARGRARDHRPRVDGGDRARRRPPRSRRPRARGPQRAPLPGLARGLPADRPPRGLQLLRGLHPHHRLDVQPARKWLKVTRDIPWRRPIASLNYLLSSHVWRQDHNGFSHQDPGFIDHVVNKKAEIIRVYLPPDANCLLSVGDHCLRSRDYVNVVVAGKQPALDYLTMDEAVAHCTPRPGIWPWASNDDGEDPDVVLACAGDIPTLETLAAAAILRDRLPELKVRFINVVDLMRLQDETEHPHGLAGAQFDALFTADRPVIFAYHGYPWLIHRLTYRRTNHRNLHVRGYKEEGTTTTPFDNVMLNDMDRYHLVMDVIDRVPGLGQRAAGLRQEMVDERLRKRAYTREHGDDPRTSGIGSGRSSRQRRLEQPRASAGGRARSRGRARPWPVSLLAPGVLERNAQPDAIISRRRRPGSSDLGARPRRRVARAHSARRSQLQRGPRPPRTRCSRR